MTTTDETLIHQITLLVIDKVLIGALIGLAALLAARSLERFKSKAELSKEINKLRVEHISTLWERLSVLHARLAEIAVRRNRIRQEEMKALDEEARIHTIASDTLPPKATARILEEVMPDLEKYQIELIEMLELLERNRFWLGVQLYSLHEKHLKVITDFCSSLCSHLLSGGIESLNITKHGMISNIYRLDVIEILKAM
jgi:hypothetical protein